MARVDIGGGGGLARTGRNEHLGPLQTQVVEQGLHHPDARHVGHPAVPREPYLEQTREPDRSPWCYSNHSCYDMYSTIIALRVIYSKEAICHSIGARKSAIAVEACCACGCGSCWRRRVCPPMAWPSSPASV